MLKIFWPLVGAILACSVLGACAKMKEYELAQMQNYYDASKRAREMMTPQIRAQCIAAIKKQRRVVEMDPVLHFDPLLTSQLATSGRILIWNDNQPATYITKCTHRNLLGNETTLGCGCLYEVAPDRLIFVRAVKEFRMQVVPVPNELP